jgi:hypothetical protein
MEASLPAELAQLKAYFNRPLAKESTGGYTAG